jgi:hypothetical protein
MEFSALTHKSNSPRGDISLHSDTIFWLRANQSLLLLLNYGCSADMQQLSILWSLVFPIGFKPMI